MCSRVIFFCGGYSLRQVGINSIGSVTAWWYWRFKPSPKLAECRELKDIDVVGAGIYWRRDIAPYLRRIHSTEVRISRCLYEVFIRVFSAVALGSKTEGQQGAFHGAQVLHAQLPRP